MREGQENEWQALRSKGDGQKGREGVQTPDDSPVSMKRTRICNNEGKGRSWWTMQIIRSEGYLKSIWAAPPLRRNSLCHGDSAWPCLESSRSSMERDLVAGEAKRPRLGQDLDLGRIDRWSTAGSITEYSPTYRGLVPH
jgi:hypothetical protein